MKQESIEMAQQPKIRVLVADDHPMVRQGVLANLKPQPDMIVVAEASNGVEALAQIKKYLPDIVLLDLRMPCMDGLEVIAELGAAKIPTKVIVMTTFETEEDIHRAIQAGACGYLLKDSTHEVILDAIRTVSRGETYLPARIVQKVITGLRKPAISDRELDVLRCVATGKSNKEIGAQLNIAEATVKSHMKKLLEKLSASGRTAAINEGVRRGLIRMA